MRHRLAAGRFQLAVLGQFKRGKSTLLNALLGVDALPTDVVPVTAIPTFLEVFLPSELLACGLLLFDTPGVGSTFRHNTAAADAVLAECDAALFVVSPDPPITEVEVQFLARVRQKVERVIVVLNKIDTLEPDEVEPVATFCATSWPNRQV